MTHWFTYPNVDSIGFRLGPIALHWYGLSYLFGFICVFLWMNRPAGRRRLGLTTDEIQDNRGMTRELAVWHARQFIDRIDEYLSGVTREDFEDDLAPAVGSDTSLASRRGSN